MKRKLTACILAVILCLMAASVTMIPAVAGAPTEGDIWSIYNFELNANNMPTYGKVPAHSYTSKGLHIVPDEEEEFTVQTEYAYSLSEGFFMEICIEDAALFDESNQLVFHLWDQMGMIVGYGHSGSGYYALISPGTDNHYVVGMVTREGKGDRDGESSVAGAIRVPSAVTDDGKYYFTISASKGVIMVNGKAISKNAEVVDFLKSTSEGGNVYVGFTMISLNQASLSPVTVTRFGTDEATATVPHAAAPDVTDPDTQPSAPTDPNPSDPEDSKPSEETQPPVPGENDTSSAQPGQDTEPEDSREDIAVDETVQDSENATGGGASEDASREPDEGTNGEDGDRTESSSGEEDTDELPGGDIAKDTLNFFNKINVFESCSATLGIGSITALTLLLSCAAWGFRRKE